MSNGTAEATVPVKDIHPAGSSDPLNLTYVNGTLFFSAEDGVNGRELWTSDGTEAGTVLVKDIVPGGAGTYPDLFTDINGTLFFTVDDGVHGRELWTSDGTEAGTVLVKDIHLSGSSNPQDLTNVNGRLLFTADDGVHGRTLWTLNSLRKTRSNEPGSLLVFPLIDNINGLTMVNIVNAGSRDAILECYMVTRGSDGGVDDKDTFLVRLTPESKLTWASNQAYNQGETHIAGFAQRLGYLFCWAIDDPTTRMEIDYDFLRGNATVLDLATASAFNYNAIPSQMILAQPDRVLRLNSVEYTAGSSRIMFEGLAGVPGAINGKLAIAHPGIDFVNSKQPEFDIEFTCWSESEKQYSRNVAFKGSAQYDLTHDLHLDIETIFTLGFQCESAGTHPLWAVFQQNLGTVFSWGGNVWQHAELPAATEIRLP
jgi:ELWxxDGT repeat protein